MNRVHLDADTNEQASVVRHDARRRSADVVEGSANDGFLVSDLHLLDPIVDLRGIETEGLGPEDDRVISQQVSLARRDPDTLPHVILSRGNTSLVRQLDAPVDLLALPLTPGTPADQYEALAVVFQLRFVRGDTDDEIVNVRARLVGTEGREVTVPVLQLNDAWTPLRVPLAALASLRSPVGETEQLLLTAWGLEGLPPRAEVYLDALLVQASDLGANDFVIRGGNGTLAGAGTHYTRGLRSFIERDWRYSRQPDYPNPAALDLPPAPGDWCHLVYLDVSEHAVVAFEDPFIRETALDGEDTTVRLRKLSQVRVRRVNPEEEVGDYRTLLPRATGSGRLTTNIPDGALPDRFAEEPTDPCRDRCLFSENVSTGKGYRGTRNLHVRVEVFQGGEDPIVVWSRDNASTVAPLKSDAPATAESVLVEAADADRFRVGDIVVVEDLSSRLDPDGSRRAVLRRLRAVDTATGKLEFFDVNHLIATQPDLTGGGPLGRDFRRADAACVRRWDGADWLLDSVRYNLPDGISFAFSGSDFRSAEYWTFTARVVSPDGAARGVVEQLTDAPVHGPRHETAPLGLIRYTETGRTFEDLRTRYLPLVAVRERLIELGRKQLAPGAFTVVVGDGDRTFGDINQNLLEGVTGDEALRAAVSRLGARGGTIYVRAGKYVLEHPVLLRAAGNIRIIGDGDASELEVTGAGGGFYLDECGEVGAVRIEQLRIVESPLSTTTIGSNDLLTDDPQSGGASGNTEFVPGDMLSSGESPEALLTRLAQRLGELQPGDGRGAGSVVRTILQLRQLQRQNPGQPLENIAPDQLLILHALPHGVVTVADSQRVTLSRLTLRSRAADVAESAPPHAAGVLITGECREIRIEDCDISAPFGVSATSYGSALAPSALVERPGSGLFVHALSILRNTLIAERAARVAIQISDGELAGVRICGNDVRGYPKGIVLSDRSEARVGSPTDRTLVSENRLEDVAQIGVLVEGDGVDMRDNEIHVVPSTHQFQAGVQITGVGNRVSNSWISLPGSSGFHALGLYAGIVVGSGVDLSLEPSRPISDLELSGNRIEGQADALPAIGILLGGHQPIVQVRICNNTLRNLGDAGIRCWGHSVVGEVLIDANQVSNVGRLARGWNRSIVDEVAVLAQLESTAFPENAGPSGVLEVLLGQTTDAIRPALDALLRWLEQTTLRGGIVLSQAEECRVTNNQIEDVGGISLPTSSVDIGAEVRTSGILLCGGRNVVASRNAIADVKSAVRQSTSTTTPTDRASGLDVLDRLVELGLARSAAGGSPADKLHGAVVALRRKLLDYARGSASERQRLGGSIYGAMEAVSDSLIDAGGESHRKGVELADALASMREAQGFEPHTEAANLARAIVSNAARITASHATSAEAWSVAADFDQALVSGGAAVTDVAQGVAENSVDYLIGLERLDIDLLQSAQNVIADPTLEATLELTGDLATIAEAREHQAASRDALQGLPGTKERTVIEGMLSLLRESLSGEADPVELNQDEIQALASPVQVLSDELSETNPVLAERLDVEFTALVESGGTVSETDVQAVLDTLGKIDSFLRGEAEGAETDEGDIESQAEVFSAELTLLTIETLSRRISGLSLDSEAAVVRNLTQILKTAGQLANLVSDRPTLSELASSFQAALSAALEDPTVRAEQLAAARRVLNDMSAAQEQMTDEAGTSAASQSAAPNQGDLVLAALGQLLLELRNSSVLPVWTKALSLFETHVGGLATDIGLTSFRRRAYLNEFAAAEGVLLASPSATTRARAVNALYQLLYKIAQAFAQSEAGQTPRAATVLALLAVMAPALDPDLRGEAVVTDVGALIRKYGGSLSTSLGKRLTSTTTVDALVGELLAALSQLTGAKPSGQGLADGSEETLVEPLPAEGVFAVGAADQLQLSDNDIRGVRLGGVVVGHERHALAPLLAEPNVSLSVADNTVVGGLVGAFELELSGTSLVVFSGNRALGCSGVPAVESAASGQAVVRISGQGELVVSGNVLDNNGGDYAATLSELVIDWRGDTTLTGNRIRHGGSRGGGAGMVLVAETIPAGLPKALMAKPALDVEKISTAPRTPPSPPIAVDDIFQVGTALPASALAGSFTLGGLKLNTRVAQPRLSILDTPLRPVQRTSLATSLGQAWLSTGLGTKRLPVLAFLRRPWRPPLVPPRPRARRAWHVSGNDVVAAGPALLMLAARSALVSITAVANEFETTTSAGAVYLRDVDTTIFSSNRCECLSAINVVVIRSGSSLVSVTGNSLAGAEPPVPPRVTRPTRPRTATPGGLTLSIDSGLGTTLNLKLDEKAVLDSIEKNRDAAFVNAVSDAKASYASFARSAEYQPPQAGDAASLREQAEAGQLSLESPEVPLVAFAAEEAPPPVAAPKAGVAVPGVAPTVTVDAGKSGAVPGAVPVATAPSATPTAGVTPSAAAAPPTGGAAIGGVFQITGAGAAATPAAERYNVLLGAPLSDTAKVFGIAETAGLKGAAAEQFVKTQLAASKGDARAALSRAIATVTGVASASEPTVRETVTTKTLLEEVVHLALKDKKLAPEEESPTRTPPPPPPNPRDHSLVLIGGGRLSAVNNVTTAGVYVHDADQSLENNL